MFLGGWERQDMKGNIDMAEKEERNRGSLDSNQHFVLSLPSKALIQIRWGGFPRIDVGSNIRDFTL